MKKAHPEYATLPVWVAQTTTDKPVPGAFFVTKQSVPLSMIAQKAYGSGTAGPTKLINSSEYNRTHCIYRQESAVCSSPKVNSSGALTGSGWNIGAWLSLCNVDKNGQNGLGYGVMLGTQYQVIWIPPLTGEEPGDLEIKEDDAPPAVVVGPITPPVDVDDIVNRIVDGAADVDVSDIDVPSIDIHINGDEEAPAGEVEPVQKAGFPWWLGAVLGLGAAITMIVVATRGRKRGRKRAAKKGKR